MAFLFGFGGNLKVTAVSGNTVTVSGSPQSCGGGKTAELRRPGKVGIQEFVGDVTSSKSMGGGKYQIGFNPGSLPSSTRPKVGESLIIYCANVSSGSSAGGTKGGGGIESLAGEGSTSLLSSPLVWLVGGGIALFLIMRD